MVKKVQVFKCADHGEFEVLELPVGGKAFCTNCGKEAVKVGEYDE